MVCILLQNLYSGVFQFLVVGKSITINILKLHFIPYLLILVFAFYAVDFLKYLM